MEAAMGVVVGGRYRLRRPLGRGGMGSVWMAYDPQRNERVAVKLMLDELSSEGEARLRFRREAVAPGEIRSPYVVAVKDHGVDDGALFLVMELLEGEDLMKRMRREGRMTLAAAGRLCGQVAEGLHEAHKLGIVHRDLKPENIFLARVGNEEVPKIIDFGIAKSKRTEAEPEATRTGVILGSMDYISPEQVVSSKDVDHRADLWSLAVIMLRLITGKAPFAGDDLASLVLRICTGPIPLPSRLAPELNLPGELDAYFERALDRDPKRRFQTAAEMAAQFHRFVAGLPAEDPTGTEPLAPGTGGAARTEEAVAKMEREAIWIANALRRASAGGASEPSTQVGAETNSEIFEGKAQWNEGPTVPGRPAGDD